LTTSAKKLQDILRAIPEHSTVSFEHEDNRLSVKAGRSRFQLQTLPADDFPLLAVNQQAQAQLTLSQKVFKDLLSQVQYAMAVQDIRYYLNGMMFIMAGDQVKLVATDGHRWRMPTPLCKWITPLHTLSDFAAQNHLGIDQTIIRP